MLVKIFHKLFTVSSEKVDQINKDLPSSKRRPYLTPNEIASILDDDDASDDVPLNVIAQPRNLTPPPEKKPTPNREPDDVIDIENFINEVIERYAE